MASARKGSRSPTGKITEISGVIVLPWSLWVAYIPRQSAGHSTSRARWHAPPLLVPRNATVSRCCLHALQNTLHDLGGRNTKCVR